jgi:hypothetical protein
VFDVARQTAHHDRAQLVVRLGVQAGRQGQVALGRAAHRTPGVGIVIQALTGQHFAQQHRGREDIHLRTGRLTARRLRRDIARRADDAPCRVAAAG